MYNAQDTYVTQQYWFVKTLLLIYFTEPERSSVPLRSKIQLPVWDCVFVSSIVLSLKGLNSGHTQCHKNIVRACSWHQRQNQF